MRGFVVILDSQEGSDDASIEMLQCRLAEWEKSAAPHSLHRSDFPGCRVFLFTANAAVPAEFNQKLLCTPDEVRLWVGPRVDMTDRRTLELPLPDELPALSDTVRAGPSVLDTAILLRYHVATKSLFVKTDLLNSTYVYWMRLGRQVLLSNSSLWLAKLSGADLNWTAVSEFLASGSIYGNYSLYAGIRTLKPSMLYKFGQHSTQEHLYWRLETLPFETVSARDACAAVVEELDRDFELLDTSGKKFILDLTAGYDSRTNLGFALRRLKKFDTTVTGRPNDEDVVLSAAVARHFGFEHKVVAPMTSDDRHHLEYVAQAALMTDLEYDVVEYARISHTQRQFDTLNEPSIHGSAGGDIARNIILRREFYDTSPYGKLIVEPLINQRFRNLIPAQLSRPDLPIADWMAHMRGRIAEYDRPELPAFARLDILYLRTRMQFWQGRIASTTNRYRSSISPFTNRQVLEVMLSTKWRERRNQMLSRLLLRALHPDLAKLAVARGEAAGPTLSSTVVALPARLRYYAGRLSIRFGWTSPLIPVNPAVYDHFTQSWEEIIANVLRMEGVKAVKTSGLAAHPQVLGRLVTLAHAREALKPELGTGSRMPSLRTAA